jgi:hypothetical protein
MRAFLIAMASALVLVSQAAAQDPDYFLKPHIIQEQRPDRYKCVDILQLESLQRKDDGTIAVYNNNFQLVVDFVAIEGWLQGFFTAMNMYDSRTAGDITMHTKPREWMNWIFNYCKSNPWATLHEASSELSKVLLNRRNGGSQ